MTDFQKTLVLVTGPVCSGKTTLALNIAREVNCAYIDKDDLVATSNAAFLALNKLFPGDGDIEYNGKVYKRDEIAKFDRHCQFFKDFIRDPEYDSVRDMVLKVIQFSNFVVVNAPYTSELKKENEGDCFAFDIYHHFLYKEKCRFVVVFIEITREVLKAQLERRLKLDPAAAARDPNVYVTDENGKVVVSEAYLDSVDLARPIDGDKSRNIDNFIILNGKSDEERKASFVEVMKNLGVENPKPYNKDFKVNRIEDLR